MTLIYQKMIKVEFQSTRKYGEEVKFNQYFGSSVPLVILYRIGSYGNAFFWKNVFFITRLLFQMKFEQGSITICSDEWKF